MQTLEILLREVLLSLNEHLLSAHAGVIIFLEFIMDSEHYGMSFASAHIFRPRHTLYLLSLCVTLIISELQLNILTIKATCQ